MGLDVDAWLPHLLALVDVDVPSEALSRLSPQARRVRTLEAVVRLLLATSRQGTLIVEIENLHWIDASSEECLTLLVERLAEAPVPVAARPEETLDRDLSTLQGAEVLYETDAASESVYRFKHALTQEATYRSLLGGARQRLHGSIAEVLIAHFPEWVEREPEQVAHHYSAAGLHEPAMHYWQLAGQRAMGRSAHAEAIRHLSRGLEAIARLPKGAARDGKELELRMLLGPSQMAVKGHAAPQTHRNVLRIEELCQHSGDVQQRFLAHFGLWAYYVSRPSYREAQAQAERLLGLADAQQDPGYLLEAHTALGMTAFWLGALDLARTHLEQAASLYDLEQHRSHAGVYGTDPGIIALGYLGLLHWMMGYPEQALSAMQAADALAAELEHPHSLALTHTTAALLSYLLRDINACHQRSESLRALAEEQSFAVHATICVLWRGALQVARGQVAAGIELLQQSIERFRTIHDYTQGIPYEQGWLAAAYGKAGDPGRGLRLVDEAIAAVQASGERWCEADLYRVKGELLLSATERCAEWTPEACFRKVLLVAHRQQARAWELRAATSLARLWQSQGKTADARNLLVPIYGWFTEGFDTPDIKEAKDLLDTLHSG